MKTALLLLLFCVAEAHDVHWEVQELESECPSGWKKFGCSCYYRTTGYRPWQQGREECLNQGADLVVINSGEAEEFIHGLGPENYWAWTGLTRNEGRWTWVDGTPLTTPYWASGYPVGEDRNCVGYFHSHWNMV